MQRTSKKYSKKPSERNAHHEAIFFGGVCKMIPSAEIKAYFELFGPLKRFRMKRLRKKKKQKSKNSEELPPESNSSESSRSEKSSKEDPLHRGCGVLVFWNAKLHGVMLKMRHIIKDCIFDCKPAMSIKERKAYENRAKKEGRKIFVGGLDASFTKGKVEKLFQLF